MKLVEYLELKRRVREKLSTLIPESRLKVVQRDPHTRRKPIGCGLTVHVGYGCTNRCLYCYIQDMGFSFKGVKPSPLSGLELAYALTLNPYFIPGKLGTFLAIGSITEPFHRVNVNVTLEFMRYVRLYLGNPLQFSTKMYLDIDLARKIRDSAGSNISPLVTVVTIRFSEKLEPNAPPPQLRFESIENLRRVGLKPQLFMRPVIPGITDIEAKDIVAEAKTRGVVGVVIGGFRVTKRIISRLRSVGLNVDYILAYTPKTPTGSEQIPLNITDIRRGIVENVKEYGVILHFHACCACAFTHSVPCWNLCWIRNGCTKCPNQCWIKQPSIDESSVCDLLEYMGVKFKDISVTTDRITVHVRGKVYPRELPIILSTLTRRTTSIVTEK